MIAMDVLEVPGGGWTTDDLPVVDFDYELVDGALLVTPPHEHRHDVAADDLALVLRPCLPRGWASLTDTGLLVDKRNYRKPDVVVYRRAAVSRSRLEPGDLLLAVEVMSLESVSNDRVTKPAQYAAAGIAHYWRLELDPVELIVHVLQDGAYREVGRFTDEVDVVEPVAVRFRLGDLLRA